MFHRILIAILLLVPGIAFAHRASTVDLIGPLQTKVSEIQQFCGSTLVSGYRPGARVLGSGHPSLHSLYPSRAADMSGNPLCIYAHLKAWFGGYSIDYGRVRHVHISWSPPGSGHLAGREWHARFAHYGSGRSYAASGHRHYAQVGLHRRSRVRVAQVHHRHHRTVSLESWVEGDFSRFNTL